jgi:hypothetical protein
MSEAVDASEWTRCAFHCLSFLATRFNYEPQSWLDPRRQCAGYVAFSKVGCATISIHGDSLDYLYMVVVRPPPYENRREYSLPYLVDWFTGVNDMDIRLTGSNPLWRFPLRREKMKRMFGFWAASLRRYCTPILVEGFNEWDSIDRMIDEQLEQFERENPDWRKGILNNRN